MKIAAVFTIFFGGLTILSGGVAIFGSGTTRALFGDVVQPVLWFNFSSGFVYALAGVGMWFGKHWSVWLSATIFLTILCAGLVLGFLIVSGTPYEIRTVGAMVARSTIWLTISWIAIRHIGWKPRD